MIDRTITQTIDVSENGNAAHHHECERHRHANHPVDEVLRVTQPGIQMTTSCVVRENNANGSVQSCVEDKDRIRELQIVDPKVENVAGEQGNKHAHDQDAECGSVAFDLNHALQVDAPQSVERDDLNFEGWVNRNILKI